MAPNSKTGDITPYVTGRMKKYKCATVSIYIMKVCVAPYLKKVMTSSHEWRDHFDELNVLSVCIDSFI